MRRKLEESALQHSMTAERDKCERRSNSNGPLQGSSDNVMVRSAGQTTMQPPMLPATVYLQASTSRVAAAERTDISSVSS